MAYQNDKVSDVIAVLTSIQHEFKANYSHRNISVLRRNAVKSVAETELSANRYKNWNSAEKTIHDACARRLKPEVSNIVDFDCLVAEWLEQGSLRLKEVLLDHSVGSSQRVEIARFFQRVEA